MKIIQEREKCIGCGSCVALCQKYWEMAGDDKSRLRGGTENKKTGTYELEVKKAECNKVAADACPVQIIHIVK